MRHRSIWWLCSAVGLIRSHRAGPTPRPPLYQVGRAQSAGMLHGSEVTVVAPVASKLSRDSPAFGALEGKRAEARACVLCTRVFPYRCLLRSDRRPRGIPPVSHCLADQSPSKKKGLDRSSPSHRRSPWRRHWRAPGCCLINPPRRCRPSKTRGSRWARDRAHDLQHCTALVAEGAALWAAPHYPAETGNSNSPPLRAHSRSRAARPT